MNYWIMIGIFLIGVEVAFFSGEFLLWLGLGALGTGAIFWAFPTISSLAQVISFFIFSLLGLLIWRKWYRSKFNSDTSISSLSSRAHSMIGREFYLDRPIVHGRGRIRVGDVYWLLQGPDLPTGSLVTIVRIEGNILCVQKQE